MTGSDVVVSARGLTKSFGDVRACAQVDLTVNRGEIVGILGPSGAGKSSLLRHFNGLTKPDRGELWVLGVDVAAARGRRLRALRRRVGVVFQQFNLVGRLTAIENVLTGALGRVRGPRYGIVTWPQSLRREALEHLARVGLADRAYQRTASLSGGQQQRVAIARALMQGPELILADEPVASLDPESAASVMDLLVRVCREDGLTVVCTLHQVELALRWTRRVIGLRNGRVVLDEPVAALSAERLRAMYGATPEATPA